MKKLVIALAFCFSGTVSAELILIPQCYGSRDVAQEEPFLVTLTDAQPAYLNRMVRELTNSGLVVVTELMDYDSSQVLILAVDARKAVGSSTQLRSASAVNRAVSLKVRSTFKKFKTNYYLECNGNVAG